MDIKLISKQSFSIIGILGQGFAKKSFEWVPPLWKEANANFSEIISLAKRDCDGNIVGIWGAMSDAEKEFERWGKKGKYLAGCEVEDAAAAPAGFTKWVIPAYKFAVVKCSRETYSDTFDFMVSEYLPQHKYSIVGAVHEFYKPEDKNGELYLYFPIEKL